CLETCLRARSWDRALQLLAEAARSAPTNRRTTRNSAPPTEQSGERPGAVVGAESWAWSLLLLSEQPPQANPFPRAQNLALAVLARSHKWEHALQILASPRHDVELDIVAYNSTCFACALASQWAWSLQLLLEASRLGGRRAPTVVTFNTAAFACKEASKWQLSLQLLLEVGQRSLGPATTISTVLSALARVALWERALQLIGFRQSAVVFGAAISACEKGWRWESAL
ncbi:unnamed protein product, partial [Polarella glacialis]